MHVWVTVFTNCFHVDSMLVELSVKDQSMCDSSFLISAQSALCRLMLSKSSTGARVGALYCLLRVRKSQNTKSWSESIVFSTETLWIESEWFVKIKSRVFFSCLVGSCTSWVMKSLSIRRKSDSNVVLSCFAMLLPGFRLFVCQFMWGRLKSPIIIILPDLWCFWVNNLIWFMHSSKYWEGVWGGR